MPLDPLPSSCPSCGTPMVPVLTEPRHDHAGPPPRGPLPAEVPVTMVCPRCSAPD